MALLLKDTPIRYRIIERQIILYKEKVILKAKVLLTVLYKNYFL